MNNYIAIILGIIQGIGISYWIRSRRKRKYTIDTYHCARCGESHEFDDGWNTSEDARWHQITGD